MSYLQFPRLIFAGRFQADPSTINNDPEHFDASRFQPNYQEAGAGASNGWWNPKGTGAWRFKDCVVSQVQYQDGTVCTDPSADPVVGMPINSVVDRVEGKLVDLDPEQQMVSAIWGLQIFLGAKNSPIGFGGDFDVTSFGDIWPRFPQGQPDSFFGAFFQSVIGMDQPIAGAGQSRFLTELQAAIGQGTQLSVKFNVDGYVDTTTEPDFTFGRIVGAIGAQQPDEPKRFVAGRMLAGISQPPGGAASLNTGYALLDGNVLQIDLGNSLPTSSVGTSLVHFDGSTPQQMPLWASTVDAQGNPVYLAALPVIDQAAYTATAAIISLPLSEAQVQQLAGSPLSVTMRGSGTLMLQESSPFVRADQFVYRFNPGPAPDQQTTQLYATQFGQPMANATISFQLDSTVMLGQQTQGPLPGPLPGTPITALSFPGAKPLANSPANSNPSYPFPNPNYFQVTTNAAGMAEITLQATDPGNPRGYIDGQVYGVTYQIGSAPPVIGSMQNPSQLLSLLVFNAYQAPKTPTWIADVQPILQQYADLYPVMKRMVDLGNYGSVMRHRAVLKSVFSTPEGNPNYMPVTRDLSRAKRDMLLAWLDDPVYMDVNSVDQLKQALQTAIELEHSTIPPYLTALYSLKPGANDQVALLIRGIVLEEMLHMTLACNILIAIGGSPSIGKKGFVPSYPGSLPGGLRPNLDVSLKKCSIEHIRDCFMSIEMPAEMVIERMRWLDPKLDARMRENAKQAELLKTPAPMEYAEYTIGWFYDQILKSLDVLSKNKKITFGNADNQVSTWHGTGKVFTIKAFADAKRAIEEIKAQGEGCNPLDPNDGDVPAGGHGQELAHYYKFSEIVEGRQLIKSTAGGYAYTGPVIPFAPDEVWPMIDNPSLVSYPVGSKAQIVSEQFTQTYQALLLSLNKTFNGHPDNLSDAIGVMYSMGLLATELMQTPSGIVVGANAGPKFKVVYGTL